MFARACLICLIFLWPLPRPALSQETAEDRAARLEDVIDGATAKGEGPAQIYEKTGTTLLALTPEVFERPILWYAEAVAMPAEIVNRGGTAVGETMVRLERRGDQVFVRDLIGLTEKRPVPAVPEEVDQFRGEGVLDPIQVAVSSATLGPILVALDIVAEDEEGQVLVDLTSVFGGDLAGVLSAKWMVSDGDFTAVSTDPARSYIDTARSFPQNLSIRSHLTFTDAEGVARSIIVGHSLAVLPDVPMQARKFDPHVGYFQTSFLEFEGTRPVSTEGLILRHRLEKLDPAATGLSDPVEPIVFFVGRGVPDRWRPYVKEGVELWQDAFEAAGFRNAIVARDAPSTAEDPTWSPEDVRHNVIRWLPQDFANAMGPVIYDPRSGEILGAHILLWPSVLDSFGTYYFLLHNTVDPDAARLPLSDAKLGELLRYIVAHEVGHTLGLRHNHLASTAYGVDQMRDPVFTDQFGTNASIMAYGRFNQVAQPGDGVRRFMPGIGPYDRFAIAWGYEPLSDLDEAARDARLTASARAAAADRLTAWAAAEAPDEFRSRIDPRVQLENTGAERIQATRLAARRITGMLRDLPQSTKGDADHMRAAYDQALSRYVAMLHSVHGLVGGVYDRQVGTPRFEPVPVSQQRAAVAYLLTEAGESLAMFEDAALQQMLEPTGLPLTIDAYRSSLMRLLLTGPRLAALAAQHRSDPAQYGVVAFSEDLLTHLFDDLSVNTPSRRILQADFVELTAGFLSAPVENRFLTALNGALAVQDQDAEMVVRSLGTSTIFPAWANDSLPALQTRLRAAAEASTDRATQLHLAHLARRIAKILDPDPDGQTVAVGPE